MALTWVVQCVDKVNTEGEFSNVCKKIGWVVMEDDQSIAKNNIAFKTGVTTLNSANSESYTAFSDLTENQCITWVKNILGTSEVTAIENEISASLTEQGNSTVTRLNENFPWS
tara:strand:- start:937 stop:1275 length:339 start_codon:yes stop_codon:yes gene_type:complete